MNPRTVLFFGAALLALPLASWGQSASEPLTLDEVVVTVQKRAQEKKEVPLSLTALTHERLDAMRVRDAADAVIAVPNTLLSEANGVNTFTVRGVGGGGRNIGFDPRVGVYIDGVYIGQSQALTMPWLDLEQAVFLRGPQGHLFGRNSVAGAVVLTTRPAEGPASASVRATAGSKGLREATVTAGAPLSDTLSGRVALSRERSDGFVTNRFDGARWGGTDRTAGRLNLGWTPNDDWRVSLSVVASDSHQDVPYGQPITDFFDTPLPGGALPPREVDFNVTPYVTLRTEGATATAVRSLGNGGHLTAVVATREVAQRRQNDTDYSAADLLRVNYRDDFHQNSQEVRWTSGTDGRFQGVLGVYGAQETAHTDRRVTIGNDVLTLVPAPGLPVRVPFGPAFGLTPGFGASSVARVYTESWAVFGNLDMALSDRWDISIGGRYTRERKSLNFVLDGRGSGALQIASLQSDRSQHESQFSPRASLVFKPNERTRVYLTAATGFKSGGWNVDFLNRAQAQGDFGFAPETVTSWELGAKGTSTTGRWSYEAALFDARFKDYQVFRFETLGGGAAALQLRNAANVHSRGAELSVNWHPSSHWNVSAQVGTTDARFTRFPDGAGPGLDLDGRRLPEAPKWTAGIEGGMDADDPPARRGLFPGGLKSKNALLSPG